MTYVNTERINTSSCSLTV